MWGWRTLFFQSLVLTNRNANLVGDGLWNVSRSSNPLILTSSLLKVNNDMTFELRTRDLYLSGTYSTHNLPKIEIFMHNFPIPSLEVMELDGMDRLYVTHGIWNYVFDRIR